MDHLLATIDPGRWRTIVLWTPELTEQSHAFYESVGFRLDGGKAAMDYGGPVSIIRYRRELAHQRQ